MDKNVKRDEAAAILREKARREAMGQSCIFISRGWLVDVANLERFSKRAKLPSRSTKTGSTGDEQQQQQSAPDLPNDICCIPLPARMQPIDSPGDFEVLRKLFHYTSVLFHSFFDRDFVSMVRRDYTMLDQSYNFILDAMKHLNRGAYSRGGALLDSAFALFDDIVQSNHPNGLSVVLKTVATCHRAGFDDIAERVAMYTRDLAGVRLEARDPRSVLFRMLPAVRMDPQGQTFGVYELFCQDLWRKRMPENSLLVLLWYPSLFHWED